MIYGNVLKREFKYYRYENRDDNPMTEAVKLQKGTYYGLSNGFLDSWDKVLRGKLAFEILIK